MYAETKFLLFTIIKSLPENEVNSKECSTVESTLNAAWKYAKDHSDKVRFSLYLCEPPFGNFSASLICFHGQIYQNLQEKIKRIQKNCQDLVKVGYLKESDNYAQLRRDAVQVKF